LLSEFVTTNIVFLVRLLNGIVTISIFPFLYRMHVRNKKRFYLLWGVGFLLYGINILFRAIVNLWAEDYTSSLLWISFVSYMLGNISIIVGIGDLVERTRVALLSLLLLPLVPFITYILSGPVLIGWSISLSPYLLICVGLIFIKRKFPAALDLFIIGWVFLFLINLAQPLSMIAPIYVDILAIIGKIVIFKGMTNPRFSFLADDMKRFLVSGTAEIYPQSVHEHILLVQLNPGHREEELEWISHRVKNNAKEGTRTILVVLYDLITPSNLREWGMKEEDLYLVRVLPRSEQKIQTFEDYAAVMSDSLLQLEILISEIISYSQERKTRIDFVVYTLSWMIHTHGWESVYSLLTSKISNIKNSDVQFYGFYYPETHPTEEITKFERLADRILSSSDEI